MKKNHSLILLFIFLCVNGFSQTAVLQNDFNTYVGTTATVQPGWYYSWNTAASTSGGPSYYTSATSSGIAPNAYKFGGVNGQKDTIITPSFWSANSVSFWCKGNGVPYKKQDTLDIYESPDSLTWTLVAQKDSLPSAGTTFTFSIQPASQYLKFVYTRSTTNGGSVAFDDVIVTSNTTGIAGNAEENNANVIVYPNPFSESATLEVVGHWPLVIGYEFSLYDVFGRKVYRLPITDHRLLIERGNLASGIYFYKLKSSDEIISTGKLVIQ